MNDFEDDPNYQAYQSLLKSDDLFGKYENLYVAIYEEKIVDSDTSQEEIFSRMDRDYKDKEVFIDKVTKETKIIRVPYPEDFFNN